MKTTLVLSFCISATLVVATARPPITSIEKRDKATATINLGPISQYTQTTTAVNRPSGTDLEVYPKDATSIPSGGAYIVFSPDLQKTLQKRVDDSNCKDAESQGCQSSILDTLKAGQQGLESRAVHPLEALLSTAKIPVAHVLSVFDAISSTLIGMWQSNHDPQPPQFHYPAKILSDIGGVGEATVVVFKTADNDDKAVTTTIAPSDKPPAPTASANSGILQIASDDADGHHKGDIEITAPSDAAADALNNFFKAGKCAGPGKQRRSAPIDLGRRDGNVIDCLRDSASNLLNAIRAGGPLAAFARPAMEVAAQVFPTPNFQNQDYATAFGQWIALAAQAVPQALPNLEEAQQRQVTITAFMLAVAYYGHEFLERRRLFLNVKALLEPTGYFKMVCPKEDSKFYPQCDSVLCHGKSGKCTSDLMKPCGCGDSKNENGKCPKSLEDAPKCADCKPNQDNGKCTTGDYKDCPCIQKRDLFVHPAPPSGTYDALAEIIAGLPTFTYDKSNPGSSGKVEPSCDAKGARSDVPSLAFKLGTYTKFCKAIKDDINSPRKMTVNVQGEEIDSAKRRLKRSGPVTSDNYKGISIELSWSGSRGATCTADCTTALEDLANSRCGGQAMAAESSVNVGCGSYSVKIISTKGSVEAGKQQCRSYQSSYDSCFIAISSPIVNVLPFGISSQWPDDRTVDGSMRNYTTSGLSFQNKNMLHYYTNIGWIPGCTSPEKMNIEFPQGNDGLNFSKILTDNYYNCDNNGIGGYRDFGCLRYGFYPYVVEKAKLPASDPMNEAAHAKQFWDQGGNFCVS